MISVKVEDGHVMGLTAHGDVIEIAMDIGSLAHGILDVLRRADPEGAAEAEFRGAMQWLTADNSPLWTSRGQIISGAATVTTLRPDGRKE